MYSPLSGADSKAFHMRIDFCDFPEQVVFRRTCAVMLAIQSFMKLLRFMVSKIYLQRL